MRLPIIVLISLALACSKKEPPAPAEAEEAEAPAKPTEAATAAEAKGAEPSAAEGEGDPTAEQPSLPPELEAATPPIADPPTIRVLEQGKEPRQALTWKLKPGLKQKLSLKLGSNTAVVVVVMKMQSPPFTATYQIAMESEAMEPTGALRVTFTIDNAGAEYDYPRPGQPEVLKPAAASMQGVTGSYSFTPRGTVEDFRIDLPPGASGTARDMADNLAWAFIRMFPTLPEKPVGEGAKWTVHRGVEQGGIHINELSTMEVTRRKGSRVELQIYVEQAATAQKYETPGGSVGPIRLSAAWGESEGTIALDLSMLAPVGASLKASVTKNASKREKGDRVLMTIHTNRSLEMPAE